MEPARLGVILDSSVVIEAERQRLDVARFLKHISAKIGEREAALCSISVAELAHGVHRADTSERRKARRAFLDDLKSTVPVYPITGETAELLAKISAELSQKGINIPFDDLLIGACALERSYAVVTRNLRHFRMIPDLEVIEL
ncbi:MAG TPA: PIN domain-containing protein [Bryobacteraceae bacterium]|nr:PIN domain-containing protein [Bryobacteraceae bacterium]